MAHSTIKDQGERADIVNDLFHELDDNPAVTENQISDYFDWIFKQAYKYQVIAHLDMATDTATEQISNANGLKAFLDTIIDGGTKTVNDLVQETII